MRSAWRTRAIAALDDELDAARAVGIMPQLDVERVVAADLTRNLGEHGPKQQERVNQRAATFAGKALRR